MAWAIFSAGLDAEGFQILQLFLQTVFAAELFAAFRELAGEVVELHGRLGAIEVFLFGELIRARFDSLEQAFGVLEAAALGLLALLGEFLACRFGRPC